jgi:hypothetical protein
MSDQDEDDRQAAIDQAIVEYGQKAADDACTVLDMVFKKFTKRNQATAWCDSFQAIMCAEYILRTYLETQLERDDANGRVQ